MSVSLLALGSTVSATDVTGSLTFVGISPCRILDTRTGKGFSGQAGPPALVANATRTFQITGTVPGVPTQCGVPTTAAAISVNFTVTNFTGAGDIRVFPAGGAVPVASILNYSLENIANSTTVPLGPTAGERGITVQADVSSTDFLADVNGYYVARPFVLESGQTVRGTYGAGVVAGGAFEFLFAALTFQSPLASAPSAAAANFIPAGSGPTTNCPGTPANPQALPGNLCVYEAIQANRAFVGIVSAATQAPNSSDTFGAGVVFVSLGAGSARSAGTWAVTAP